MIAEPVTLADAGKPIQFASVAHWPATAELGRYAISTRVNLRIFLLMVTGSLVLAPLWTGTASSSKDFPRPAPPADIALERPSRSDGAMVVKLRLDSGEQVLLKVDTGAPDTALDESFAPKLGRRMGTRRAHLVFDLTAGAEGIYRAPKLYAGDTALLTGPQVYTIKKPPTAGDPAQGILGMDCLANYCIQFDFLEGKMRFLDPDHLNTNDLGEAFAVRAGTQTLFDADLFGQGKTRFLLDTGMSGPFDAMLAPKVFERFLHQYPTVGPNLYMKVNDGREASARIFPRATMLGLPYTDLRFSSVDLRPRSIKGIIGMRFLARHKITLNFPKGTLYLKPISSAPLDEGPGASSGASHNLPLHWPGSSRFGLVSMGTSLPAAPGQ